MKSTSKKLKPVATSVATGFCSPQNDLKVTLDRWCAILFFNFFLLSGSGFFYGCTFLEIAYEYDSKSFASSVSNLSNFGFTKSLSRPTAFSSKTPMPTRFFK